MKALEKISYIKPRPSGYEVADGKIIFRESKNIFDYSTILEDLAPNEPEIYDIILRWCRIVKSFDRTFNILWLIYNKAGEVVGMCGLKENNKMIETSCLVLFSNYWTLDYMDIIRYFLKDRALDKGKFANDYGYFYKLCLTRKPAAGSSPDINTNTNE